MGKSAKIHKRTRKKTSNAGTSTTLTTPTIPAVHAAAAAAVASAASSAAKKKGAKLKGNKRAKLRSVSSTMSTAGHGHVHVHVLGGADYVDIMMGSRRREREEALKLPRDTDES